MLSKRYTELQIEWRLKGTGFNQNLILKECDLH